ncbi:MAG: alpha/beta hydrolase [Actinobacteria bacterium]|nr:alpha/beta hydrolase [Actinomycetota bacterium]
MACLLVSACGGGGADEASGIVDLARGSAGIAVVELPVAFDVINQNQSLVPCATDGRTYTVRGSLVAPASLLDGEHRSATLYLHGGTAGESTWRFTAVAGYDFATEMAKLGRVSVVIDRLGYDSSGHPHGTETCAGGEADVYHQILGQLRSGSYSAAGGPGVAFDRLAVAGHSQGALVAEIVGYSFQGLVDAIAVMGWVDAPLTSTRFTVGAVPEVMTTVGPACLQGGEPAESGDPGSPSGYTDVWPSSEAEARDIFRNVDPEVREAFKGLINRDACGFLQSVPLATFVNNLLVATIAAPVLLLFGDQDLMSVEDAHLHGERFLSSKDVSVEIIEDTGHAVMLERTAAAFRARLSRWLAEHGF